MGVTSMGNKTFTLTANQDTIKAKGQVIVNGPLVGGAPTLTTFDSIVVTGPHSQNSVLNAFFNGDSTANGVNIDGIPTWDITTAGAGTVSINTASGLVIRGLTNLNFNGTGGTSSLNIGPIVPAAGSTFDGFTLNVASVLGAAGNHVDLAMAASGFSGTDTITVNALDVGTNGIPYGIAAGSPTKGFQTWVVNSDTSIGGTNNIALGGDGSTTAKFLTVTDNNAAVAGTNTTLWATTASGSSAADFANVTNIDLTGTSGFVRLTGAENDGAGFLSANNAIHQILGGSGNSLYDLTSLSAVTVNVAGFQIIGGSSTAGNSEVAFNVGAITGATHLIDIEDIQVLDASADNFPFSTTINMAFWAQQGGAGPGLLPLDQPFALPNGGTVQAGFDLLQLLAANGDPSPNISGFVTINNGPVNFAINMQDANFNVPFGFTEISINAGPIINTADHLQVWMSDQGSIFDYTVDNYTRTDFLLPTEGGTVLLGTNFFKDQPVVSVTNATLGFFHNTGDTGSAADNLSLGHTSLVAGLGTGDVGTTTVFLDASGTTTINFGNISAGTFVIGATDATDIFAGLTSHLVMDLPGTNLTQFHEFSADFNSGEDLLQGVSGAITLDTNGHAAGDQVFGGPNGSGELVGGSGTGSNFFPESPFWDIFLEDPNADVVWFAQYDIGHSGTADVGTVLPQAVTDVFGTPGSQFESFVNGYGFGADTVFNFTIGNPFGFEGDVINLNTSSWATSAAGGLFSGGSDLGLTDNFGAQITTHGADATMALYTTPGAFIPTNFQVTLDGIATYTSFNNFVNAIESSGTGNINFNAVIGPGDIQHHLVAVNVNNDIILSDVTLTNTTGGSLVAGTANAGVSVGVNELVDLVGVGSVGNMLPHDIHFV
jgi:hypothetical protein